MIDVNLFTREYPPNVYGGAGVHVEELSKALAQGGKAKVNVHTFDGERGSSYNKTNLSVFGYEQDAFLSNANQSLKTLSTNLEMASAVVDNIDTNESSVLHSHTWYANAAGMLTSMITGLPHIISAHSLEPLRPWKREQLGGGYEISSFIEREAYEQAKILIAVSYAMAEDIKKAYPNVNPEKIKVVHNGIDLAKFKRANTDEQIEETKEIAKSHGLDLTKTTLTFVGRITKQKGLVYLMEAIKKTDPSLQFVLCAGAPDTPELANQIEQLYRDIKNDRGNIIWIDKMLPNNELQAILQNSHVFLCPSIYEPLGIVNLEAMALDLPVVATRTGGIPEVVLDNETGFLVDLEKDGTAEGAPADGDKFSSDIAAAIQEMTSDLDRAKKFGVAGRKRCEENFTWQQIADKTLSVYKQALGQVK